jgi:hypothetical protein
MLMNEKQNGITNDFKGLYKACRMDQDDKYREFLLITVMPDVVNRASIFNLLWMDPR